MRRLTILILLITAWVPGYCQEFLSDPDYIYGVGVGKTQEEADNQALIALSKTLYTRVGYRADYTLTSVNGKSDSDFRRSVELESALSVEDALIHTVQRKNRFTVYRYVNKVEYVERHTAQYRKYSRELDYYLAHPGEKHSLNLILGNAYMAYRAIDNPIMDCCNAENETVRHYLLDIVEKHYRNCMSITAYDSTWCGIRICLTGGYRDPMFGIEYEDDEGKWRYPTNFRSTRWVIDSTRFSESQFEEEYQESAFVETFKKDERGKPKPRVYFRILYEIRIDGKISRIYVPEKWYVKPIYTTLHYFQ